MTRNWKRALTTICVGLLTGWVVCTSAAAQVDWVATLNAAPVPVALSGINFAAVSDGSTVSAGMAITSEGTRARITRITSSGTVQWVRWATGNAVASPTPLWTHPDNSTTVAYQSASTNTWCFENFSAAGESRFSHCPTYFSAYQSDMRVMLAADGDFYFASNYSQRTIRKVSPLGVTRWTRTETVNSPNPPTVHGVDSSGNYFEALGTRLVTWSASDGTKISDVTLAGAGLVVNASTALARANRDVVFTRAQAATSNAMTATITRSNAAGAIVWSRDLTFPGYGPSDRLRLTSADADGTYVIRTAAQDGDSHVAKISVTGVVLWQKHYSRVRRILDNADVLTAVRTDVSTVNNSNDSFLFPINSVSGTLGTPMIFSRADLFAPSEWFATATGALATYQGNNPFAPFGGYTIEHNAMTQFVGFNAVSNRWLVRAEMRPSTASQQAGCLMPRLSRSSPSSWWARTYSNTPVPNDFAPAAWSNVDASMGTFNGKTVAEAAGCGSPVTADGGQIIVNQSQSERVKKVDATGASVWQTTSSAAANYYYSAPLVSIAGNGEATYAAGSLVGRVSATGVIGFEVDTNRTYPRYLARDSSNNAWLVSGYVSSEGYVSKVSSSGTLLWSVAVDNPSCSDSLLAARLTPSDEMLVATQSCGEGRLFKFNGNGQVVWQRVLGGTSQRPSVMLSALQFDIAGNIYAGGCMSSGSPTNAGANAMSVVSSWTSAGAERWTAITKLLAGASECVTSIAIDAGGDVYAASSSTDAARSPVLWSLNNLGVERWRHSGVLANPVASFTELVADTSGKLMALGEAPPSSFTNREASLRRLSVAGLGSPLRLKFLSVPTAPIAYRSAFSITVGLRTAADGVATATVPTVVSLGLLSGTGRLDGALTCTIAIGASDCTITDARYDVVESGITLMAGSDGFASVNSDAFSVTAAPTVTTLTQVPAGPHAAFSVVRITASVQAPLPPAGQTINGYINGPYGGSAPGGFNCDSQNVAGSLPANSCDFLAQKSSQNLVNAYFSAYVNTLLSSSATPLQLDVTKVTPTLQVSVDPVNTYVSGDRVRLRVSLVAPSGYNVSQFVAANTIAIPGGSCSTLTSAGAVTNKFAGSYWVCQLNAAALGSQSINVSFLGNDDLLAVGPVTLSVTTTAGAVVRGTNSYLPNGVSVCSTAAGVTCSIATPNGYEWQCTGPTGANIDVFFVPSANSNIIFQGSPLRFNNVSGVVNSTTQTYYNYASNSCKLDVDGDGAWMAMTDGVLILRRMLGLSGPALTNGATHACAPLSAAGISNAINLTYYDVDGDGQTLPETDGLILLRALLGFKGDALVTGAISATATRKTALDIRNFLAGSCSFYIN